MLSLAAGRMCRSGHDCASPLNRRLADVVHGERLALFPAKPSALFRYLPRTSAISWRYIQDLNPNAPRIGIAATPSALKAGAGLWISTLGPGEQVVAGCG
jgi:hypothetical protein